MEQMIITAVAVLVGILSSARLTRLVAQDSFPPSVWARIKWDNLTEGKAWNPLLHCHWCLAPWFTAVVGLWGWLSGLHVAWWVFNAWLAASYVASMIVERDEKE
jgi:hypothetical protein